MRKSLVSAFLIFTVLCGCFNKGSTAQRHPVGVRDAAQPSASVDRNALDALAADIRQGHFGNTHALLVFRHNQLAYESYFVGDDKPWGPSDWERRVQFGPTRLHDARSVTKTVISTLVGTAIRDGYIKSVHTPLYDLLPSYRHLLTGKKRQLTLWHFLTMTTGLQWNELGAGPNDELRMYESADPTAFVLQRPVVAEPGAVWEYNGGATQLLGVILEASTGQPIEQYARKALFEPLGIVEFEWRGDVKGMPSAASGLRLLPRDFAKLGGMFEDSGRWRGRRVVPAQWLAEAMRPQIHIPRSPEAPSWSLRSGYGFQWWYDEFAGKHGRYAVATASGLGGQRIFVVQQYDLVVIVLSGHFEKPDMNWTPERMLQRVIEAVRV